VNPERIDVERIPRAIHVVRGQKVIVDRDLAERYGFSTGNLNKAVTRNLARFPLDFTFQLGPEEIGILKFQAIRGLMAPTPRSRRRIGFH
jgi:hypothetical protein